MLITSAADAETYRQGKLRYDTWIEACFRVERLHCGTLAAPKVVYERMSSRLYGYYDGSDTVYVNKSISASLKREVLLHEMIHYVQSVVGKVKVPGPAKEICAMEEEAFRLVDEWLVDMGWEDRQRGPDWWKSYRHCYKFYGPKDYGSSRDWFWNKHG